MPSESCHPFPRSQEGWYQHDGRGNPKSSLPTPASPFTPSELWVQQQGHPMARGPHHPQWAENGPDPPPSPLLYFSFVTKAPLSNKTFGWPRLAGLASFEWGFWVPLPSSGLVALAPPAATQTAVTRCSQTGSVCGVGIVMLTCSSPGLGALVALQKGFTSDQVNGARGGRSWIAAGEEELPVS